MRANLWIEFSDRSGLPSIAYRSSTAYRYDIFLAEPKNKTT